MESASTVWTFRSGRTIASKGLGGTYRVTRDSIVLGEIQLFENWVFCPAAGLLLPGHEDGFLTLEGLLEAIDAAAANWTPEPPIITESGLAGTYYLYRDGQGGFSAFCKPDDGRFWFRRSRTFLALIRSARFVAGVRVGTPLPPAVVGVD